ncbi:MAG: DUF4153 domain-containing protein [Verrucomicrobia bacterium]|nr:DUF4153 domain-containing protein [Verrucomicrobiota bacterium]
MKTPWRLRIRALPGLSLKRVPVALTASLLALIAAITLHHRRDWGLPESIEGNLFRALLLWPFALFGSVGLALRGESQGGMRKRRPVDLGQLLLIPALFIGYLLLPAQPQDQMPAFWFRYTLMTASLLFLTLGLPARRQGTPDLWDSAWPILLSGFMATLTAMLVVGGVNLALVSIDKLFGVRIDDDLYVDIFFAGFFLLGPITAMAWLPHPFGARVEQPGWLRGTVQRVLTPLCLLYAFILAAYLIKIAIALNWPDGWVAMPTLIFGALGLAAYLIARPAVDRTGQPWAGRFCRIFPWVLLPLAIVLILAMRVRITEYGFTEWRVIGLSLGLWFTAYALAYSLKPALSSWWIAASLSVIALGLSVGPLSASNLSRASQQARLNQQLAETGVREGLPVTLEGEQAKQVRSGIQYLLRTHGPDGLPDWMVERWMSWRDSHGEKTPPRIRPRYWRRQEKQVLEALNITLEVSSQQGWHNILWDQTPIDLTPFGTLHWLRAGETNSTPFQIDHQMKLTANGKPVGREAYEAFVQSLEEQLVDQPTGPVRLPAHLMSWEVDYQGEAYQILIPECTLNPRQTKQTNPSFYLNNGALLFQKLKNPSDAETRP